MCLEAGAEGIGLFAVSHAPLAQAQPQHVRRLQDLGADAAVDHRHAVQQHAATTAANSCMRSRQACSVSRAGSGLNAATGLVQAAEANCLPAVSAGLTAAAAVSLGADPSAGFCRGFSTGFCRGPSAGFVAGIALVGSPEPAGAICPACLANQLRRAWA